MSERVNIPKLQRYVREKFDEDYQFFLWEIEMEIYFERGE